MALTFVNSTYSFVQFGQSTDRSEMQDCVFNKVCLPIIEDNDLCFQFRITSSILADIDTISLIPEDAMQLVLLKGVGNNAADFAANTLRNFTIDDGKKFKRYRISATEMVYCWDRDLKDLDTYRKCGECFELGIIFNHGLGGDPIKKVSNCFIKDCDNCDTSLLSFYCDEDSYDFRYCNTNDFVNKVRLPLYITRPQPKTNKTIYVRSEGDIDNLKAVKSKQYSGVTDYLNDDLHFKIDVALDHDHVSIVSKHYSGGISLDGDYNINWLEFMDHPTAPANFKVFATPYNVKNDNCQECGDPYGDILPCQEPVTVVFTFTDNDEGAQTMNFVFTNPGGTPTQGYHVQLVYTHDLPGGGTGGEFYGQWDLAPGVNSLTLNDDFIAINGAWTLGIRANCTPDYNYTTSYPFSIP